LNPARPLSADSKGAHTGWLSYYADPSGPSRLPGLAAGNVADSGTVIDNVPGGTREQADEDFDDMDLHNVEPMKLPVARFVLVCSRMGIL